MEAFSDLRTPVFTLNDNEIKENIEKLCFSEKPVAASDRYINNYYLDKGPYLWINRHGVDSRADTLLATLMDVGAMGFTASAFYADKIEKDLARIRNLEFDDDLNTINHTMARLEYFLTKAFLRYAVGQRFGFVNPELVFNRLDTLEGSGNTHRPVFRRLFDVKIQHPDRAFFGQILESIHNYRVGELLEEVRPTDTLYYRLQKELAFVSDEKSRMTILCNMERFRWRELKSWTDDKKYVVVNIPAFHLYAFGGDTVVDMRIGCGTKKTKTPLLTSCIERMDVNPVWNIPMSIIKKDVVPRAGDTSYFKRNRYYIVERETGERVESYSVTSSMLMSGAYRVVQEGGEGNSMGRIVFRFPNNFSVFLHDTSSKGVFARNVRSVSHGCVRVQSPFDLAEFMLADADDWLLDKLRISMGLQPKTPRGVEYVTDENRSTTLVRSLAVKPCVPLYITYYTMFPDPDGRLRTHPDIYGFDDVIYDNIKPFMKQTVK